MGRLSPLATPVHGLDQPTSRWTVSHETHLSLFPLFLQVTHLGSSGNAHFPLYEKLVLGLPCLRHSFSVLQRMQLLENFIPNIFTSCIGILWETHILPDTTLPEVSFCYRNASLALIFFFMLIYLIFKSAPTTQGSFQFNLNVSSRRHGRPRAVPGAPGMHESHSTTWVAWKGKWVVCCQALQIHKPQRSWEVVMGILVRKTFGEHERLFWAKECLWTCVLQWEGRAFRRGPWDDPQGWEL